MQTLNDVASIAAEKLKRYGFAMASRPLIIAVTHNLPCQSKESNINNNVFTL